jgi:ATP-dependent exoDNAse (exonuclease V) beta subunit
LRALGVGPDDLPSAADKVALALTGTLTDPRGRWILSSHSEAESEYAIAGVRDGEIVGIRIDRTFIDENGTRWIIDFKTSAHEGGDREGFLDSERDRYASQLQLYRDLLSGSEQRPVRTALYFPLLAGWREDARTRPSETPSHE